ncbi:hypothetical protein SAMN06265222_1011035 [Neorhodopirellula lusitana]|uniref:Uncharacterized protein n=1 Tax=Neorhodopirellula lusitana TaxID=445327 RepID=A0ABY1PSN2_9BACT|nr:hypothetical protein SAMN06265222_1011035 [Neorhodopirellula lusitana]
MKAEPINAKPIKHSQNESQQPFRSSPKYSQDAAFKVAVDLERRLACHCNHVRQLETPPWQNQTKPTDQVARLIA